MNSNIYLTGSSITSSQCFHSSRATFITSCSLCSAAFSFLDKKAKGCRGLLLTDLWERTTATPTFDASTSTTNCWFGFRTVNTGDSGKSLLPALTKQSYTWQRWVHAMWRQKILSEFLQRWQIPKIAVIVCDYLGSASHRWLLPSQDPSKCSLLRWWI